MCLTAALCDQFILELFTAVPGAGMEMAALQPVRNGRQFHRHDGEPRTPEVPEYANH